jgi:arylformamidase
VIEQLSAVNRLAFLRAPIVIAHGTKESPEFMRQSRDFAALLQASGKKVKYLVGEGYNHFELPETYANPYGLLGRAALELMGLEPNGGKDDDHDD